jgi:hypothetical protein
MYIGGSASTPTIGTISQYNSIISGQKHKKELCPPALILSGQSLGEFRSEERE